jgi:hypothetical protein
MIMLKYIILIILATLAAAVTSCGGGGGSSLPTTKQVVTLFEQTPLLSVIHDPGDESQLPRDKGFVVTFDSGAIPITIDSRGVGFTIDTWATPPGSKAIKTVNLAWMPSNRPYIWRDNPTARICTSFTASQPDSFLQSSLMNYSGADLWLQDASVGKPTSGRILIISGFFFVDDGRGTGGSKDGGPYNYLDALNAVQFSGPLANSYLFWTTAGQLRNFAYRSDFPTGFCITRDQAEAYSALASSMLGGRIDPADLVLKQALIGSEVNLGTTASPNHSSPGSRMSSFFNSWLVTLES